MALGPYLFGWSVEYTMAQPVHRLAELVDLALEFRHGTGEAAGGAIARLLGGS